MKRVRKYLVEFFGFSQSESKGFIFFLGFLLVFSVLSSQVPQLLFKNDFDNEASIAKIDAFLKGIKLKSEKTSFKKEKTIEISDPNTMSFLDWTKIGLDQYLANRIVSYRLHGGVFRKKEDLKKIYGFNDSIYSELDQYLLISYLGKSSYAKTTSYTEKKNFKKGKTIKIATPVKRPDLNSCDSFDLLFIKGIGPARASRIIKYRTKLGGFSNEHQLSEIYGLDSIVLENLINNTVLENDSVLKKIDLNSITFKDLLKHPYVDYNTCKVILNFRSQHGRFKNMDDLRKIKIIDPEFMSKMNPYLQFL